jgi:hypothetical protein
MPDLTLLRRVLADLYPREAAAGLARHFLSDRPLG